MPIDASHDQLFLWRDDKLLDTIEVFLVACVFPVSFDLFFYHQTLSEVKFCWDLSKTFV